MCDFFPLAKPTKTHELCSIGQIKQAFLRLDTRKARDPDDIPPWLLKNHAEDLAPVIAHLINTSYQVGILPTAWKKLIYAQSQRLLNQIKKSDWRPISLTSCISKIQERFVLKELMPTVLKEYNNQYAYLPKHSSTNALVNNIHTWLWETDSQQLTMVRLSLADMSKAFDRVDHTRLFQRLTTLNLCPQLLAWLFSYTTGR